MSQEQQIFQLIPKVMREIGAVGKDRKNEQQGYKFRGIEDFYNAAHPALVNNGVFCCPQVLEVASQDRITSAGKPCIRVTLKVCHKFYAPDGSFVDVVTCGEGIDSSDKATNKAMSAAMKYALIELFSVPTQDVEDADYHDPEVGAPPMNVDRIPEDIPLSGKDDSPIKGITADQAKKIHMRFRESLPTDMRSEADALLHDWLAERLYLDEHGNPSALAIPKDEYKAAGQAAVAFARGLGEQSYA